MFKSIETKRVVRQAKKVGKVAVKEQSYINVMAFDESGIQYGLNVHASGKIEFFRDSMYAAPDRSLAGVYKEMMQAAHGV